MTTWKISLHHLSYRIIPYYLYWNQSLHAPAVAKPNQFHFFRWDQTLGQPYFNYLHTRSGSCTLTSIKSPRSSRSSTSKSNEVSSETDDMLPDAIPRNTQCQGLTGLSRTWSAYSLCSVVFFLSWSCWCDVANLQFFFSHPYLSLNMLEVAAIGWHMLPPLLWNFGPGVCTDPSFKTLGPGKF